MKLDLPRAVEEATAPVFSACPLEEAMHQLVVTASASDALRRAVAQAVEAEPIAQRPALQAGLWLYADELEASHRISQSMGGRTGAFWHGIMHRREGDFGNSKHWLRQAGHHPAMAEIEGHEPGAFIDEVAEAHRAGQAPEGLVDRQRREWATLFQWCAAQGGDGA
jgi:hypothetical protein